MTERTTAVTRRALMRWLGWFSMANALVLGTVGLLYFQNFHLPESALALVYLVFVYIGHHVMLAAAPLLPVAGGGLLDLPSRRIFTTIAVVIMAAVIAVYVLDGLLWSQSRFHISALTVQILGWQSWVFVSVIFVIGLVFESLLAGRVWAFVEARPRRGGAIVGWTSGFALLGAWLIYAWADANYHVPVTSLAERLPVYKGFTAKRRLEQLGLVDLVRARERELGRRVSGQFADASEQLLDYPASAFECANPEPRNLLVIMLDAWRFDMLDDTHSPRISQFGRQGQVFSNHFSGGNGSRSGAFSFFYGLPPTYWPSVKSAQYPAILIEELRRQNYQMGIFASSSLISPVELDRTAFSRVEGLRTGTEPADDPSWRRDRIATREWMEWLDSRDPSRPFFGFLFYDSTNTNMPPPDYPVRFDASGEGELAEKHAGYRAASHYVDSLTGLVLDDLASRQLLQDTVVVITADHGEEFDDSGHGLDEHGSGFTRFQLQVPLVVHWPGKPPAIHSHRTSHYDITPTLLNGLLACAVDPAAVSSGKDLFSGQDWDWLIAASYYNFAVLEPDRVTVTYPSGAYEVRDWDYDLLPDAEVRSDVLLQVMSENRRFHAR